MKTSKNGIDFVKQFEGCRLTAYKCPAGIWTIGYGHTAGVKAGQSITQEQAEAYLRKDLMKYEKNVAKYDKEYVWTQNQFDALVSFAYNIGNIDQLTANGTRNKDDIAEKMLLYNKAGGKVLAGLSKRRYAEQQLFRTSGSGLARYQINTLIVQYSLHKDGERQISKSFKTKEFKCKDGSDKILVDVGFVQDKLQAVRDYFGAAVTINSAYRTEAYNRKVGGAKSSYHLKGQAFDIVVKGHTPAEVARCAQQLGILGIIQYNSFVHVDSRTTKYWARNDNGKVTIKRSFG